MQLPMSLPQGGTSKMQLFYNYKINVFFLSKSGQELDLFFTIAIKVKENMVSTGLSNFVIFAD